MARSAGRNPRRQAVPGIGSFTAEGRAQARRFETKVLPQDKPVSVPKIPPTGAPKTGRTIKAAPGTPSGGSRKQAAYQAIRQKQQKEAASQKRVTFRAQRGVSEDALINRAVSLEDSGEILRAERYINYLADFGNESQRLPYQPTNTSNPHRPRTLAAGYDKQDHRLDVRFRDGTPWSYYNVPPDVWRSFRRTRSPGKLINRTLNNFPYGRGDF